MFINSFVGISIKSKHIAAISIMPIIFIKCRITEFFGYAPVNSRTSFV